MKKEVKKPRKVIGVYKCRKCGHKFEVEYTFPSNEAGHAPRPKRICPKCDPKPKGGETPPWDAELQDTKEVK